MAAEVRRVVAADLDELLVLARAYCDFYGVEPSDGALRALSEALLADPQREGVQLIAREESGEAVGFATIFWSWATTIAARIGVMNDLYVVHDARGTGVADALVDGCLGECARHGAARLEWQTAPENHRAQAFYERIGGIREEWVDYWLAVTR